MSIAYGITCMISLLMIAVYFFIDKKRNYWLMLMTIAVFCCNFGWFLISVSRTLPMALMANRLAYIGSVFLPLFMVMLIGMLCEVRISRAVTVGLLVISCCMLYITLSPGISDMYYTTVSLEISGGAARLLREYGVLHPVYFVYLFAYFGGMLCMAACALRRRRFYTCMHAAFVLTSISGNIVIWLIEQFLPRAFEFLSVSYIISEAMILLLYGMMQEYHAQIEQLRRENAQQTAQLREEKPHTLFDGGAAGEAVFTAEQIETIMTNCTGSYHFSEREKEVLRCMLANKKRREIAEELYVTESTIKKYTSQIYRKLEVGNRMELFLRLSSFR